MIIVILHRGLEPDIEFQHWRTGVGGGGLGGASFPRPIKWNHDQGKKEKRRKKEKKEKEEGEERKEKKEKKEKEKKET